MRKNAFMQLITQKWFKFSKIILTIVTIKYNFSNLFQLYYFVEETKRWKTKDPKIPLDIYYPRNNLDSEIFIGISTVRF